MKYVLALVAGALGCLLLALYTAGSRRALIQEDLWNRAKNALTQAPVRQLVITADGREITLRGSVPNEAAKRSAGKAVENAEGVHTVTNLVEIAKGNDDGPGAAVTATQTAATTCQEEFTAALRQEQIQFEPNWYAIQAASFPLLDRLVGGQQLSHGASRDRRPHRFLWSFRKQYGSQPVARPRSGQLSDCQGSACRKVIGRRPWA